MPDQAAVNPFGTIGDLNQYRGSKQPTGLPQWLLDQFKPTTTVDESGGQTTTWSLNDNPYGGFQRNGKYYVQVGSNKLKDPSKVEKDPELGDITEVGNVNDLTPQGPNYAMLAAVVSAGLLGPALGIGAAETGGAAAGGLQTLNTGLSGLFTGAPELAPATANYAAAGAFGGAGESLGTALTGASPGVDLAGNEIANVYAPEANPTAYYEPLGTAPTGGFDPLKESGMPHGGDNPYGTEIPNEYTPGSDPSKLYDTLGSGPSLGSRLMSALTNPNVLSKIPSLAGALGITKPPSGGTGTGGSGAGLQAGGSAGSGRAPSGQAGDLQQNPYLKARPTAVKSLGDYLRGA